MTTQIKTNKDMETTTINYQKIVNYLANDRGEMYKAIYKERTENGTGRLAFSLTVYNCDTIVMSKKVYNEGDAQKLFQDYVRYCERCEKEKDKYKDVEIQFRWAFEVKNSISYYFWNEEEFTADLYDFISIRGKDTQKRSDNTYWLNNVPKEYVGSYRIAG